MTLQHIYLRYNDKKIPLTLNKAAFEAEMYADCRLVAENGGERLQINIHPKQTIDFQGIELRYTQKYAADCRIFCNGWQSWTESREFRPDEKMEPLLWAAKPFLGAMGDANFYDYPNKNGCLHSWSYSYIRDPSGELWLTSLNENSGFTLIEHDVNLGTITISTEKLELEHSFPALDLFISKKNPFDIPSYFQAKKTENKLRIGWTSWYQHYTAIDAEIIAAAANNFQQIVAENDYLNQKSQAEKWQTSVQIDDGWQQKIGDWLNIKNTFPKGMEHAADAIRAKGSAPGLWLAPFICEAKSDIFLNKKDWLLADKNGKPVVAGYNPLWSGWFYALDFYNEEVQNYLRLVLQTTVLRWGYRLLKLDFLYAVCLFPPKNKTRGQVMHDAMAFLAGIIQPHAQILACGIPLAAAFGTVEYCRIGADTHLAWEHFWLRLAQHRERVSTQLAVRNTVGRHHLNGRVFANDPDVFILRKNQNKLTETQRQTIFMLNTLLGNVWFLSDDIANLPAETQAQYQNLAWLCDRKINRLEQGDDCCIVHFEVDNQSFSAYFNLSTETKNMGKISLQPFSAAIL